MKPPNCIHCKHRRSIPGDAHSRCAHPEVGEGNEFEMMAGVFMGDYKEAAEKLNIRAHVHGIQNGWFMWPANFDPTWLTNCNGFVTKINNN